jgi:sulfur carrier protein ThiS adenylyltransferase
MNAVTKPGTIAFAREFFAHRDPAVLAVLRQSSVGIAGAGGLGSNVAVALARAGVGRLVIADCDEVEPSNLNRQQYFIDQVGERKVAALRENLLAINPFSLYEVHDVRVTRRNAAVLFGRVDVLVEAFDRADAKEMLIEASLSTFPGRPIVAASGLAGYGGNRKIHARKMGNLYICGDESSQCPKGVSPMAPRVALVAAMQANLVVELLVKMRGRLFSDKAGR